MIHAHARSHVASLVLVLLVALTKYGYTSHSLSHKSSCANSFSNQVVVNQVLYVVLCGCTIQKTVWPNEYNQAFNGILKYALLPYFSHTKYVSLGSNFAKVEHHQIFTLATYMASVLCTKFSYITYIHTYLQELVGCFQHYTYSNDAISWSVHNVTSS